MSRLVALRASLKELCEEVGVRFSYMPILVKAISTVLKEYPVLNAVVNSDCTTITYKADHNIGIAMDTPDGLVVPNIKQVQVQTYFIHRKIHTTQQQFKLIKLFYCSDISIYFRKKKVQYIIFHAIGPIANLQYFNVNIGTSGSIQNANESGYPVNLVVGTRVGDSFLVSGHLPEAKQPNSSLLGASYMWITPV